MKRKFSKNELLLQRFKDRGQHPGNDVFRALGESIENDLPKLKTYAEIGRILGESEHNARHITMLALGKLAWYCRKSIAQNPYEETTNL